MGPLDTLPRTAGESKQLNAASVVRKNNKTGHTRDKEMEADMIQRQWGQHWIHQMKNTGQLLPSDRQQRQQACYGQCLYRSHSDKHRRFPGLRCHLWSEIPTERLPELWAEAVWGSPYALTKGISNSISKFFLCPNIFQTSYNARCGDSLSRKKNALNSKKQLGRN